MSDGVERIRLDDGTVIWARIGEADGPAHREQQHGGGQDRGGYQDTGSGGHQDDSSGGYQDTGAGERVLAMVDGLSDVVGGVVRSLRAGLAPAGPEPDTAGRTGPVEVAVNFGIELSAQSGKIVGVLASAGGRATLSVSLTWTEHGPAAPGTTRVPPSPPGSAG
ncbi:CU044_2847 family protein [Streptomyces sp. NPDC059009]|uniref:CU044_2847 family protein n=1 Tax=Streptomyces sp. NPDC059009 TaxID=3346694 RepID=UPI00369C0464